MMKVLLVLPTDNLQETLGKGKLFVQATQPHNLLSLAAYVRENGFPDIKILDAYALGLNHNDIASYIREYDPQVIGLSCYTSDSPLTIQLTESLKRLFPKKYIVLGGVHASVFYKEFLTRGKADFIVYGEGESTFLELLKTLRNGGSLGKIKGLFFRENDEFVRTGPRPFIENLDILPKEAWDLAPMHLYRLPFHFHSEGNRSLITSRGCPVGCTFCAVHQGKKIRYQSAHRVVDDFMELVNKYDAKHIHFMDSLFVGNKQRIIEIMERLIASKNKVSWSCSAHVNFLNRNILKLMKRAGCSMISYGIESGVQELLNNIKKRTSLDKIKEIVGLTNEVGLKTRGLFMLGLPGETEEKSLQTIKFALSLPLDSAQFAITTPYPGTELYYQLVKDNKINAMAWERYSAYSAFTNSEPIYVPGGMTSSQLKKLQKKALIYFYFRPKQVLEEIKKLRPHNIKQYLKSLLILIGFTKLLVFARFPRNN
tara:strand:- start:255 stop:1703 length:1449 start_codon:yes stop_codon:yes gene_type:complete